MTWQVNDSEIGKIDSAPIDGLLGVSGSLGQKVHETEKHFHNWERWFGPAAVASGENHIADPLGEVGGTPAGVTTSFQVTSGVNNEWGTAIQVFGATDAAVIFPSGKQVKFDVHHIRFTDVETDRLEWLVRVICGTSAAAGVTAETYTQKPFFIEKTNKNDADAEVMMERCTAGDKVWLQALNTSNASALYLDIQFGAHGYSG
jgi:hypothetical protein